MTQSAHQGDAARSDSAGRLRAFLVMMLMILLASRPLFPSEGADLGDGVGAIMLALATLLVAAVFGLGRPWTFRLHPVDLALAGLVLWSAGSGLYAVLTATPRPALNVLWEWVNYLVLWGLIRQLRLRPIEQRAVLAGMLALSVGIAGYGLYQYFYELPALRRHYQLRKQEMLHELGWEDLTSDPVRLAQFENRLFSREPLGTFALTNSLAGFLLPWTLLLTGVLLSRHGATGSPPTPSPPKTTSLSFPMKTERAGDRSVAASEPRRLPVALPPIWAAQTIFLAALLLCLVLTKSRSAYAGLLVGLSIFLVSWFRQRAFPRWLFPLVGGLLTVAIAVAAFVRGLDWEVLSEAGKSLGYRWQYWQATAALIAEHPLLGCGLGNFRYSYTRYKLPEASEEIADPHNFLLEVTATAGLPAGLLLLIGGALTLLVWRKRQKPGLLPPSPGGATLVDAQAESEGTSGFSNSDWRSLRPLVVGWLLAWPIGYGLGLLSSAPQSPIVIAVSFPPAAAVLLVTSRWVRHGQLSHMFIIPSLVGISVHWLAAGGIGFPGVAGSFWLLWALSLEYPHPPPVEGSAGTTKLSPGRSDAGPSLAIRSGTSGEISVSAWGRWLGIVMAVLLIVGFYTTAYTPVLESRAHILRGHAARQFSLEEARALYLQAATADPWAFEPWLQLVALWQSEGQKSSDGVDSQPKTGIKSLTNSSAEAATPEINNRPDSRPDQLAVYTENLLRRAPNNHAAYWTASLAYRQLFDESHDEKHLRRAITLAERAIQLYPNQATYHAGLAELFLAARDTAAAGQAASKALWLHEVTPHADRKLPPSVLQSLNAILQVQSK